MNFPISITIVVNSIDNTLNFISGVIIQNLDTGVDVTHPVFFRPDGGSFDWIDVDSDGLFSPGVDAVDLDNDGSHTSSEVLSLLDERPHVHFLRIGQNFVSPDGSIAKDIMPDFLHLTPKGYEIWAKSIEPMLAKLMGV